MKNEEALVKLRFIVTTYKVCNCNGVMGIHINAEDVEAINVALKALDKIIKEEADRAKMLKDLKALEKEAADLMREIRGEKDGEH